MSVRSWKTTSLRDARIDPVTDIYLKT